MLKNGLVPLKEAKKILPFTFGTIKVYACTGKLPVTMIGHRYYFYPEKIEQWLKDNTFEKGGNL